MRALWLLAISSVIAAQENSAAKEEALGARLAQDYQRRMTVVENAKTTAYLEGLVARLRAALPDGPAKFRVSLVANEPDGRLETPLGLPGGYLIVATRIIAEASDETVFARQVARAMARLSVQRGWRGGGGTPAVWVNRIDDPAAVERLTDQMMREWVGSGEFASVQAGVRAQMPQRTLPSLRRAGEARPQ